MRAGEPRLAEEPGRESRPDGPGLRGLAHGEYESDNAQRLLCAHFGVQDLNGFGCQHLRRATAAAGCLLNYVKDTQRSELPHIRQLSVELRDQAVAMDAATRRNLELDINLAGGTDNTLASVLDR